MIITEFDVAICDSDTHISRWVLENRSLRIATWLCSFAKPFLRTGSVVVDAGANIGDHTVEYAMMVGESGTVVAFEPNSEPADCLAYNTKSFPQVQIFRNGLSDVPRTAKMFAENNVGASYVSDSGSVPIELVRLDDVWNFDRLDFIKMDIEGYETKAITGGIETIRLFRPVMLLEVNVGALQRAGSSEGELLSLLRSLNYRVEVIGRKGIQYDILCVSGDGHVCAR